MPTLAGMRLLLMLFLSGSFLFGCEADGWIWMPYTNDADALYRVVFQGRAGFIDRSGRMVIPPTLEVGSNWGQAFYNGLLSLGVGSGPFLTAKGEKVLDNHLYRIWDFSERLAAALKTSNSRWGYIDQTGKFVITPRFPSYPHGLVSSFSEGLAAVEVAGKLGYIDHSGVFVIPLHFAAGMPFKNGMARVVLQGPCMYTDYESIDPCLRTSPRHAPATVALGRKWSQEAGGPTCQWTFVNRQGKRAMSADFEAALDFHDGLAAVKQGDLWGFVDEKGKMVIPLQFRSVHSFSEGLALVESGTKAGFIDKTGALKIALPYNEGEDFSDHLAVVGRPNKGYVYIDHEGKQAIPGHFILASRFFHGIAHVKIAGAVYGGGTFAYIDTRGYGIYTYQRKP